MKNESEKGFSLIELVIVVSVLSVLSAIAVPTFNCFQRKSKATAALAAIKQIQTECEINKADTGIEGTFTSSNLNSYQIQSDGTSSNSCGGVSETGLISAIPNDTNLLPTFILAINNSQLTYSFKGETGTDFSKCLSMICFNGNAGSTTEFQTELESYEFVQKDTFFKRNNSCYVLVDGPKWSDAQANAVAIGGNLVTINDEAEDRWIAETYLEIGQNIPQDSWGVRNIHIGLTRSGDTGEKLQNAAGHSDGWVSGESSSYRPGFWGIGEGMDWDGNFSSLVIQQNGDITWNDFPATRHDGQGMVELACN
ncbi:nuclease (SNase-like) protein [Prochlorococcus sp. MIT 0801]|nr:nuclease (SNase-like) protein [Prochlorococcus sp. MIT 0801]